MKRLWVWTVAMTVLLATFAFAAVKSDKPSAAVSGSTGSVHKESTPKVKETVKGENIKALKIMPPTKTMTAEKRREKNEEEKKGEIIGPTKTGP
jgi:hypothetical protein